MELDAIMRRQGGVVSRRQVIECGWDDNAIARMIRRRRWVRLCTGVYVDHTGPPSWRQRAWAGTLLHAPAALDGTSALAAFGARVAAPHEVIDLVVSTSRRVEDPDGVRTRRTREWERVVQLHLSPPRVRLETALLTAASRAASDDEAVALLGDLVQRRRTTAVRLQSELQELSRLPRRRLLNEVLDDVSAGALSALERRYLRDVERAHGLPRGRRQVRATEQVPAAIRDVVYAKQSTVVELDGRLGRELWRARWADLDRDLRALVEGAVTVRIGWGQVLRPCRVADAMCRVLIARGWAGRPVRCEDDCELT